MDYARTVTSRLPATYGALHAGRIHPVHARIIEDETRVLSAKDAAKADAVLAEAAGRLTFGKLRAAAHRLVLELDPESAERRKEAAKQDAHVRRFREDSGNGGMVARELPSAEVLASWQHVEQRALDLRAAGRHPPPGTSNVTATPGPDPPPGSRPRDWIDRLRITMTPIARGTCSHDRAEPGYRPSRKLQHLVKVRNARCTAPCCGRPAARCDLDHTIAWDQGGLTCECDPYPRRA